jgi:hypothetical protein
LMIKNHYALHYAVFSSIQLLLSQYLPKCHVLEQPQLVYLP